MENNEEEILKRNWERSKIIGAKEVIRENLQDYPILFGEISPKNLKFFYEEIDGKIEDAEEYVKNKLQNLGWKLIKTQGILRNAERMGLHYCIPKEERTNGKPDFLCIDSLGNNFYIEVKTKSDGLRGNQIKWIMDNPTQLIIVYYIFQKRIEIKNEPPKNPERT